MNNVLLTGEFYDQKSFFSLGGAATAVWVFTNVIGNVFGLDIGNKYRWIALFLSVFISYLGAYQIKKMNLVSGTLTIFNGFLIFVAASGINAINHGIPKSSNLQVQSAAFFSFFDTEIWWKPTELVHTINVLNYQKDSLAKSNEIMILQIIDSCTNSSKNIRNFENNSDFDSITFYKQVGNSLNLENQDLKKKYEEIMSIQKNQEVSQLEENNLEESFNSEKQLLKDQILRLQKANLGLEKNLKEYIQAGSTQPVTQAQAYRELNKKVIDLNSNLKEYKKEIQLILSNLN